MSVTVDVCVCARCLQLDHHCPWTGKCVGEHNLRPFYVFVFSVQFLLCYCIIGTVTYCIIKYGK